MSRQIDIEVTTNADFRVAFGLVDPDGIAVDLSNAAIRMDMVKDSGSVALEASVGDGIEITDAQSGYFDIAIPEDDMNSVPVGLYNFDLLVGIGSVVTRVAHGTVMVREGYTTWVG